MSQSTTRLSKTPHQLLEGLFAFSPNRDTLGGTAYFIVEKTGNMLVDCPLWDTQTQGFLEQQGGVRWLFITHRGALSSSLNPLQTSLNCEIIIQEQEAYLLPELTVTSFSQEIAMGSNLTGIWTPGHSPGSSCLYWNHHGGILFTGRHLLPDSQGKLTPLRLAKTFHWFRQVQRVAKLRDRFTPETLSYVCPGSNTGFLRGKGLISDAYQQVSALDLEQLRQTPIGL